VAHLEQIFVHIIIFTELFAGELLSSDSHWNCINSKKSVYSDGLFLSGENTKKQKKWVGQDMVNVMIMDKDKQLMSHICIKYLHLLTHFKQVLGKTFTLHW
jgi:hypothetical protein